MDPAIQEIIDRLDQAKGAGLRRAKRKALKRVGEIFQAAIVTRCPEQAGVPEGLLAAGELKASIKAKVHIASDQKAAAGRPDHVTIAPDGDAPYLVGDWVENGHAGRTPNSKRTPPHPFIRPAADAVEGYAEAEFEATMVDEITKILTE